MNKNYTLKELADIGAKAAGDYQCGHHETGLVQMSKEGGYAFVEDQPAREAFTKAILDTIGYEFPKDEEREAFERWKDTKKDVAASSDPFFDVWKAGREELRRATAIPVCAVNPDAKPKEPAWIPWEGGECPLPDTVKRWEMKTRSGNIFDCLCGPSGRWNHVGSPGDIVAYRVWEG